MPHNAIVDALTSAPSASPRATREGSYFTEQALPVSALQLSVQGVGALSFPLAPEVLKKLIAISHAASYGLREKTLTNSQVRHTHEIRGDQIHVTYDKKNFKSMMEKIRVRLGLDSTSKLVPHLHNMLIYESGQFFKTHQDTEKLESMVATLVVSLPSPHIGGDLKIYHNDKKHIFVSENLEADSIPCVAFYADCPHEIEKVKKGTRIVLTYNLTLESAHAQPSPVNAALVTALKDYFDRPEGSAEPVKLVYLLEHSYTEHGLSWQRLKGTDSAYARDLVAAARACGIAPHLALAEIHQSWGAEYQSRSSKPKPGDLICDDMGLSTWFDSEGKRLPYGSCALKEDEMVSHVSLEGEKPDEEEYEGYMGNYGETFEYWYRRAAIVLWAERDQFAMQFKFDYPSAVEALVTLTQKKGNEQKIRDHLKAAGDLVYQYRHASHPDKEKRKDALFYLPAFARIAAYINHADEAKTLMQFFAIEHLRADHVEAFALLHKQYGSPWCLDLWAAVRQKTKTDYSFRIEVRPAKETESLLLAALKAHFPAELLNAIVANAVDRHVSGDVEDVWTNQIRLQENLEGRMETVKALLRTTLKLENPVQTLKLLDHIKAMPARYPVEACAAWLIDLQKIKIPSAHQEGVSAWQASVASAIDREIAQGERQADDWHLDDRLSCACPHCQKVNVFLASKEETSQTLAIVQQHRTHVTEKFKGSLVPVDLTTIAKGSPHKLVLTKRKRLHHDAQERYRLLTELRRQMI